MGSDADPPSTGLRIPVWNEPTFDPDFPGFACRQCPAELQLHQPDPADPARLLGICPACGAWYLISTFEGHLGAAVAALPDGAAILSAIAPGQAPPGRDGPG